MTWISIAIAGWLTTAAVVGLFVWSLGRAAAIGDRDQLERMELERAFDAETRALDERIGPEDRRTTTRPWAAKASGRRAEDALRADLAEAHRALRDAEARLAEIEERRSA